MKNAGEINREKRLRKHPLSEQEVFLSSLKHFLFRQEVLTIKEFAVKHRHASHTTNELEVGEVVFITQTGVGVDL